MRTKLFLVLLLMVLMISCAQALWAADNFTPLNVKEGLWEVTVTHSMTGMPAMNIPPETLAKMPPAQRAQVEGMMKGTPTTDVRKECVTKEKLEKNSAFANNRGECTRTVVSSTGRKLEVKFHCEEKQSSSDGTFQMEALGSDSVKGTMHMTSTGSSHNMTMDFTFNSKYLGAACGDVK